jgi:hypothetical protein
MGIVADANGQFAPGQIILNNTYVGRSEDLNFVTIRNEDSGLELRCRRRFDLKVDFNVGGYPLDYFFGLSSDDPGIVFPVVRAFDGDYSFLLEPPNVHFVFPGGVCVDLVLEEATHPGMCLRRSRAFYNGNLHKTPEGNYVLNNKYEMMVHHSRDMDSFSLEKPCAALIFRLGRHYQRGMPQTYKHIDADLLGFYSDQGVYEENLRLLADLRNGKIQGDVWWNHALELPGAEDFFERMTIQRDSPKRDEIPVKEIKKPDLDRGHVRRVGVAAIYSKMPRAPVNSYDADQRRDAARRRER